MFDLNYHFLSIISQNKNILILKQILNHCPLTNIFTKLPYKQATGRVFGLV